MVEDDAVLMNGLQVGLGLAGFTVDAVATCADASAALRSSAFDAIVLDLMVPDGSGPGRSGRTARPPGGNAGAAADRP